MMELKSLHFLRVSLQLVSRVLTKLTAFFAQCSPLEVRTFSCEETLCKIQARRLSFGLLFFFRCFSCCRCLLNVCVGVIV